MGNPITVTKLDNNTVSFTLTPAPSIISLDDLYRRINFFDKSIAQYSDQISQMTKAKADIQAIIDQAISLGVQTQSQAIQAPA